MIAPQVQVGPHTFDVKVIDREDGSATVELRRAPIRGDSRAFSAVAEAVFPTPNDHVIETWIAVAATNEAAKLDRMRAF